MLDGCQSLNHRPKKSASRFNSDSPSRPTFAKRSKLRRGVLTVVGFPNPSNFPCRATLFLRSARNVTAFPTVQRDPYSSAMIRDTGSYSWRGHRFGNHVGRVLFFMSLDCKMKPPGSLQAERRNVEAG